MRDSIRTALSDGYRAEHDFDATFRERTRLYDLAKVVGVGALYHHLSDHADGVDPETFVSKAEQELDARLRRVER